MKSIITIKKHHRVDQGTQTSFRAVSASWRIWHLFHFRFYMWVYKGISVFIYGFSHLSLLSLFSLPVWVKAYPFCWSSQRTNFLILLIVFCCFSCLCFVYFYSNRCYSFLLVALDIVLLYFSSFLKHIRLWFEIFF